MIEKLAEWWVKQNGRLLLLGLLILGMSGLGVSASAAGLGASLGVAFVGNGFEEFALGASFSGRLDLGILLLFDLVTFGEGSRGFGVHAGWEILEGWLAVGVRVLGVPRRGELKTIWQVGARAGVGFPLVGMLSLYNELGAYAPLGVKGDVQPFFTFGLSVRF